MDDGDVGERTGPERVRVRDVHPGLRRHADVADRMRERLAGKAVAVVDGLRVARVLDQLEPLAEREDPHARAPLLDLVGEGLQAVR